MCCLKLSSFIVRYILIEFKLREENEYFNVNKIQDDKYFENPLKIV